MSIMFTYSDNYVRKQTSSSCEDAVQICILFCKKCKLGQNWPVLCQCVCIFNHADEG